MEISIRKASPKDGAAICDIHVASIRDLGRSHYSKDQISSWSGFSTPEGFTKFIHVKYFLLAECKGEPVGFGSFDFETGELIQLYVKPDFVRKGIGTRILIELLAIARKTDLTEVFCEASLNSEGFYDKIGFESGTRRKHRFRDGNEIDCIPMKMFLK